MFAKRHRKPTIYSEVSDLDGCHTCEFLPLITLELYLNLYLAG